MLRPLSTIVACAVLAAVALASPAASARKPPPQSPEAAKKDAEARELYERATRHYDVGQYDVAIEEYREAYVLSNRPELLFNLGQASKAKRDFEGALTFYRTYLKLKPQAANRKQVEQLIDETEQALKSAPPPGPGPAGATGTPGTPPGPTPPPVENPEPKPEVTPEPTPEVTPEPTPVPPPVVEHVPTRAERTHEFVHSRRGRAVIGLAAVSVASLVGAAVTGGLAVGARHDYDASCAAGCNDALYTRGHGLAIATDVLIGVGVAAAITTVIVALVRPHKKAPSLAWSF